MDDTPEQIDEELARIQREAAAIDVNRYAKRFRIMKAIAIGAAVAGFTWLGIFMFQSRRNPCERVRDHLCHANPSSPACSSYEAVLRESIDDPSPRMRSSIRAQCMTKIARLKDEDGVDVP